MKIRILWIATQGTRIVGTWWYGCVQSHARWKEAVKTIEPEAKINSYKIKLK